MDVIKFVDAPFYTAPGHEDVVARRLQGGAASPADFVLVGHSSIPPGALIPMSSGTFGKIYVVTEGEILIEGAGNERHLLGVGDSIHILAGEVRAVRNTTREAAAMIVITPPTLPA